MPENHTSVYYSLAACGIASGFYNLHYVVSPSSNSSNRNRRISGATSFLFINSFVKEQRSLEKVIIKKGTASKKKKNWSHKTAPPIYSLHSTLRPSHISRWQLSPKQYRQFQHQWPFFLSLEDQWILLVTRHGQSWSWAAAQEPVRQLRKTWLGERLTVQFDTRSTD